jgi:2-oxoglutarate dehydrogenase E1 component
MELTQVEKQRALKLLIRETKFEEFLAKEWSTEKRLGLEGCEVLIPAMKELLIRCRLMVSLLLLWECHIEED